MMVSEEFGRLVEVASRELLGSPWLVCYFPVRENLGGVVREGDDAHRG
jgi:hypothetical protein